MHRIARRDLLRMRMACQFESHQRQPERLAFSYELAQHCSVNGEARSLSLNNGSVDGNPAVESCPAPPTTPFRPNMPASTTCPSERPTTREIIPAVGK